MLETIREYALELAQQAGELAALRQRHAAYFLRLVEAIEPHLYSGDRSDLVWLEREDANLRAVLAWSTAERAAVAAGDDSAGNAEEQEAAPGLDEVGLRLVAILGWYWFLRGRLAEGRAWCEAALARADPAERSLARGKALQAAAYLAWLQADLPTASAWVEEAAAIFRAAGATWWLAYALLLLGTVRVDQGRAANAEPFLKEGRLLHRQAGNVWGEAVTVYQLGVSAASRHDRDAARARYEESLGLFRATGDGMGTGLVLDALGLAAAEHGDIGAAHVLFAESLSLLRAAGDRYDLAQVLVDAGTASLLNGDMQAAKSLLLEGMRLWRDIGVRSGIVRGLAGLARVAAAEGAAERAGRLFGATRALLPASGRLRSVPVGANIDGAIAEARARLDHERFEAGWAAGQSMAEETAIAEALTVSDQAADDHLHAPS
jgi:hypothetical protein